MLRTTCPAFTVGLLFCCLGVAQALPFAAGSSMLHLNGLNFQFAALQQAHMCYAGALAVAAASSIATEGQARANLEAWRANLESQTKKYAT